MRLRLLLALLLAALAGSPSFAQQPAEARFRDVTIAFTASDGTPLEGKLSLPVEAEDPVPVLFYLHGAGPGTYHTPRAFRGADGQPVRFNYYDYFAGEMARRGLAFFRISKRGVTIDPATGREVVDRAIFSGATRGVLLDDYKQALAMLRRRPEIDPHRIVIGGVSEGTAIAARLAGQSPDGVVGVVLHSYNGDNNRDTGEWQTTIGRWRNVQHLCPAARDGALTREEYDAAVQATPRLANALPFDAVNVNRDDRIDADDLLLVTRPRHDALLQAVEERNDELLWNALLSLTSAYLLEDWTSPPASADLLRIDVPIGIFHGELDGTTRVEAVRETEAAFIAAGKRNLRVWIYPGTNHDLAWTPQAFATGGPEAYRDSFDFVASLVAAPRD